MRILHTFGLLLALSGCSTELTPQAQLVRQISSDASSSCNFLGAVSGTELFGLTTAHDAESALNKVRNAVAARDGNSFVLTGSTSNEDATIVQADAYNCQ